MTKGESSDMWVCSGKGFGDFVRTGRSGVYLHVHPHYARTNSILTYVCEFESEKAALPNFIICERKSAIAAMVAGEEFLKNSGSLD